MVDEETTDVGHHVLDRRGVRQSSPNKAVRVPINHIHDDNGGEL